MNNEVLTKLTTPKPHRKGASEEQIFAKNEKMRMTAKLVACVVKAGEIKSVRS